GDVCQRDSTTVQRDCVVVLCATIVLLGGNLFLPFSDENYWSSCSRSMASRVPELNKNGGYRFMKRRFGPITIFIILACCQITLLNTCLASSPMLPLVVFLLLVCCRCYEYFHFQTSAE
ncbi:hypothetical protein Tcan_09168, partial [Toxocara canis]